MSQVYRIDGLATGRDTYYGVLKTPAGLFLAGATPEAQDDDRWPLYAIPAVEDQGDLGTYLLTIPDGVADGPYTLLGFEMPASGGAEASSDNLLLVQPLTLPLDDSGGGSTPATATAYAISLSSSSGAAGTAVVATVLPNGPLTGTITLTPSGGGLATPHPFVFSASAVPQSFAWSPSAGGVTFAGSNSAGLIDPSPAAYTAIDGSGTGGGGPGAATAYALSLSASSGVVGAEVTVTVLLNGTFTGSIAVAPSGGGLSAPHVFAFAGTSAPQSFAWTTTQAGSVTFTASSSGALDDPDAPASYVVTPAGGGPVVPLPAYVPTTFMPAAWLSILTIPPPPLPTALKSSARVAAGAIDPNKSKARAS